MKLKNMTAFLIALTAFNATTAFTSCGEMKTIEIAGSTSVQPLMGALADAYMAKHSGVQVKVEGGGSSIGISNAKEGKGDFGMASKAVFEEGVKTVKICDDGIVVVVNKANPLNEVSGIELFNFYVSGIAISSATVPVSREAGSGTRDAFEGLVKDENGKKLEKVSDRASAQEFSSTGTAITYIAQNENALGYISLGAYDPQKVKKLTFEGVEGTAENIKNGSYQLARPFNILYNATKNLSQEAKDFLDFVLSDEGQAIVAEEGYITL